MNLKKEFIQALNCKQPEYIVPLWELEFHLWDQLCAGHFIVGKEFLKLTEKEKSFAIFNNAEIIAQLTEDISFAAVTIPGNYWEIAPGKPAYFFLPEPFRTEQAKALLQLVGDDVMLIANTGGILAMPDAKNYVAFSVQMLEHPEEVDLIVEKTYKDGLEQMLRFRDIGIETFLTASDIADNSGPYFNRDQMDRFILPYLEKWACSVKEAAGFSILHTDGNISVYLEPIAKSGINALQAIDPVAGLKIEEVKNITANKICLCGNIDIGILISGKPEEIYEYTKRTIDQAKNGGGFVLGASNAVQKGVPVNNYNAYYSAWLENGKYSGF